MADTMQAAHPIQVAARRTGLSMYVLRVSVTLPRHRATALGHRSPSLFR